MEPLRAGTALNSALSSCNIFLTSGTWITSHFSEKSCILFACKHKSLPVGKVNKNLRMSISSARAERWMNTQVTEITQEQGNRICILKNSLYARHSFQAPSASWSNIQQKLVIWAIDVPVEWCNNLQLWCAPTQDKSSSRRTSLAVSRL